MPQHPLGQRRPPPQRKVGRHERRGRPRPDHHPDGPPLHPPSGPGPAWHPPGAPGPRLWPQPVIVDGRTAWLLMDQPPMMTDQGPLMTDRVPLMTDRGPVLTDRVPLMTDRDPVLTDRGPLLMMDRHPIMTEMGPLPGDGVPWRRYGDPGMTPTDQQRLQQWPPAPVDQRLPQADPGRGRKQRLSSPSDEPRNGRKPSWKICAHVRSEDGGLACGSSSGVGSYRYLQD